MAQITFQGNPIHIVGELPPSGEPAPAFTLVDTDLQEKTLEDFEGHALILNIFPSLDTGVCAASVRQFNERAADLEGAEILNVSLDLPFAQARFCGAEDIEDAQALSGFRNPEFGTDWGVVMTDGPFRGLYSRAVVVLDADHDVIYTEQVPAIGQEPDYEAALAALAGE